MGRVGEHGLHRPLLGVHAQAQHLRVLRRIDLARQARQLGAVGAEEHHRRVAAHLEAGAQLLRAGAVAVDVDRHEGARALDEVHAVEQRRLDLIARRAPLGAPVDEDRLAVGLGLRKGGVDLGVAARVLPGDALGACVVGRCGRDRGGCRCRRRRVGGLGAGGEHGGDREQGKMCLHGELLRYGAVSLNRPIPDGGKQNAGPA